MPGAGETFVSSVSQTRPLDEPREVERVPMWLAIAITVAVSLPFGLWLGNFNLPLWVSFIVWAEYFQLGAKPSAILVIVPAFLVGVGVALLITTANVILEALTDERAIVASGDVAAFVAFFFGFCVLLYAVRFVPLPLDTTASLPFFNGISMMLGVFFTGAFLTAAPEAEGTALEPAVAAVGVSLAMALGCFLGWFNVAILFRRSTPDA
ncbi:MAG: DUF1097 family protein [Candidatus Limnocylindrales bacterium]